MSKECTTDFLQGLNQLPNSFYPHVGPITSMNRAIAKAEFLPKSEQVQLSWKDDYTDTTFQNATYDYVMVAAPFSKVRSWRFPNTGGRTSGAIMTGLLIWNSF